jgi:hypothetical protein
VLEVADELAARAFHLDGLRVIAWTLIFTPSGMSMVSLSLSLSLSLSIAGA